MNNLKELKNIPYDAAYKVRKTNGNLEKISIDLLSETISKHAKKEGHILSIGCGDGNLEKKSFMQSKFKPFFYTGIDINNESIEEFKKNIINFPSEKIELFEISLDDFLKNNNKKFDIIIFSHAFYFFIKPDEIIEKCLDILNDKGKIIIINNNTSLITKTKDEFSKILNTNFYVTTEYILNSIENSKLKNFINIEKHTKKANLNTSILNEFNLESALLLSFLLGVDVLTIPEKELLYLKNKFKNIKYINEKISSLIIEKNEN